MKQKLLFCALITIVLHACSVPFAVQKHSSYKVLDFDSVTHRDSLVVQTIINRVDSIVWHDSVVLVLSPQGHVLNKEKYVFRNRFIFKNKSDVTNTKNIVKEKNKSKIEQTNQTKQKTRFTLNTLVNFIVAIIVAYIIMYLAIKTRKIWKWW